MVDMYEVSPKDVPANAQLIDVREDDEYAIDRAQGVIHIPMGDIPERYKEIDPDKDIYVICKAGGRSMQVCGYLENALGWDNVINVAGGRVDADRFDRTVEFYYGGQIQETGRG